MESKQFWQFFSMASAPVQISEVSKTLEVTYIETEFFGKTRFLWSKTSEV